MLDKILWCFWFVGVLIDLKLKLSGGLKHFM